MNFSIIGVFQRYGAYCLPPVFYVGGSHSRHGASPNHIAVYKAAMVMFSILAAAWCATHVARPLGPIFTLSLCAITVYFFLALFSKKQRGREDEGGTRVNGYPTGDGYRSNHSGVGYDPNLMGCSTVVIPSAPPQDAPANQGRDYQRQGHTGTPHSLSQREYSGSSLLYTAPELLGNPQNFLAFPSSNGQTNQERRDHTGTAGDSSLMGLLT